MKKDLIAVDLIQRKITWGEANKKYMASKVEYQAKFEHSLISFTET